MKCIHLTIFSMVLGILYPLAGFGQYSIVLADSFNTMNSRIDLSERMIRFGETDASSAFEIVDYSDSEDLVYPSIHMNALGEDAGVCCTYDNGSFLAHNCIDYIFPEPLLRSDGDTLRIEFDGIWEVANDKKGEASKLIAYLMYNYPAEGPPFGVYNDLSADYYGKPAYQLWILNGSNRAFMTYGGGVTPGASFIQLPAGSPEYWLPGFTDKRVADGEIDQQDPYPASDYGRVMDGPTTSQDFWMHYTWEITEDRLSVFWRRSSETEEDNVLLFFMEHPEGGSLNQINSAHGTAVASLPPYYEWLDEMNAFRMFINKDSWISNLTVSKTGTPQSTYFSFAKSRVKVDESEGIARLPVLITNPSDTAEARVEIALIEGDSSLVDSFSGAILHFPVDGPSTQSLELNITGDEDLDNDKLIFELRNASGGYFATIHSRIRMELIVDDDVSSSIGKEQIRKMRVSPNPANQQVRFSYPDGEEIRSMEVFNVSGVLVDVIPIRKDQRIDVSHLPAGHYWIRAQSGRQTYRTELIILR